MWHRNGHKLFKYCRKLVSFFFILNIIIQLNDNRNLHIYRYINDILVLDFDLYNESNNIYTDFLTLNNANDDNVDFRDTSFHI